MEQLILKIDKYVVHIYFEGDNFLSEAKNRGVPLNGPYSVIQHQPHTNKGQQHLHVYCKNNQIFALNKDGTAHDKSHGKQIPNRVIDALKIKFPDIKVPFAGIIESADKATEILFQISLLTE